MNHSLASSSKSALILVPSLRRAATVALGALLIAAGVIGCGASDEPARPVAAEQAQAAQAPENAAREHMGIGGAVTEAALKLDLTPQQKQTVEGIRTDLQAKSAPVKEARAQYHAALADAVAKGTVDAQTLATPKANLARAAEAMKPALEDALNRLHATLNADQRGKLVELMQQDHAEGHKGFKHGGEGMRGHMKKMAAELELTPDQISTLKTNLHAAREAHVGEGAGAEVKQPDRAAMEAKHEAMRTRMHELADAFKADAFDARTLDIGKELGAMAGHRMERAERFLAVITPTLTAQQRAKLAAMIQKHGAGMDRPDAVEAEEE